MSPTDWAWQEWLAWGGIVLPLIGIAYSAVRYVSVRNQELHHQAYQRFFEITDQLGQSGGSIVSKMAAAYELRKYPQYKDVIIRLCEDVKIEGGMAQMLDKELKLTAEFMREQQNG